VSYRTPARLLLERQRIGGGIDRRAGKIDAQDAGLDQRIERLPDHLGDIVAE